jgi:2-polyprenyl-6-methoxyphenol hydroxylase-like FAD-dependent oxidoreductase
MKVDDCDPASVIEHVKRMIRKLRSECELRDILLIIWQRSKKENIDPLSVNAWKSSRVTLLGDTSHAMNPVLGLGIKNAFKDAEILSQSLLNYSSEIIFIVLKNTKKKC